MFEQPGGRSFKGHTLVPLVNGGIEGIFLLSDESRIKLNGSGKKNAPFIVENLLRILPVSLKSLILHTFFVFKFRPLVDN